MKTILLLAGLLLQGAPEPQAGGGTVAGRVLFADGSPAAGIHLSLESATAGEALESRRSVTDNAGTFRLDNVAPGRYYLKTGGYGSKVEFWHPAGNSIKTASEIVVTAGSIVLDADIVLAGIQGFTVAGHVRGLPETSAESAPRRIYMMGESVYQLYAQWASTLAPDGSFRFPRVPPGEYTVRADVPHAQAIKIRITDADVAALDLAMPPLVMVSGTVAGANAAGLEIEFRGIDGDSVTLFPDGTFKLLLPPGEYRLNVGGLGSGAYLQSAVADKMNLVAEPLKITAAAADVKVAMTLGVSAGVRVRGHVTMAGRTGGLPAGRLYLTGSASRASAEAPVAADGSFEFARIVPGMYRARMGLTLNVASPPIPIEIPSEDVADLPIAIPAPRLVSGEVTVLGNGPPPRFSLLLVRASGRDSKDPGGAALPSLSENDYKSLEIEASSGLAQVLTLRIEPLPDATFKMTLPEGEYRVVTGPEQPIPAAYRLTSLNYGGADLFQETLKIDATENLWLHVGFEPVSVDPWVKLSGHVSGLDPAEGRFRVALSGDVTSPIEANVNADGTFEFLRVLRDTSYRAQLVPRKNSASTARVKVADKDVSGIEIVVPSEREIRGRASVVDEGPIPSFVLSLAGSSHIVTVPVRPDADGWFKIKIPEDPRQAHIEGYPVGYVVESMTYGGADVQDRPLKGTGRGDDELQIVFAIDASLGRGAVKGRVRGLDEGERAGQQVRLTSLSTSLVIDVPIHPDGTFQFEKIPLAAYAVSLPGSTSWILTPAFVTVSSSGGATLDLAGRAEAPRASAPDDRPVGVSLNELGFDVALGATESAAVANLRTLNVAQITYLSSSGGNFGDVTALVNAGLLDSRFLNSVSGYSFFVTVTGADYAASAAPSSSEGGRFAFFTTPDGVIRYSPAVAFAPPGEAGNPVQ